MSPEIEIIFSPIHAEVYKDKEHREKRIKRLEELTGLRFFSEFDDEGRFIIRSAEDQDLEPNAPRNGGSLL